MNKVLLVIDVQEVFVGENHSKLFSYDHDLVRRINSIIDENCGNLIVYVQNIMKRNFMNKLAPFHTYENTSQAELAKSLKIVSDNKFVKYEGDAFSNSELDKFLKNNHIDTVEVTGIDGGACVPMTALGAIKNGYKVIINNNGIGTFNLYKKKKEKYDIKLKQLGAEFR